MANRRPLGFTLAELPVAIVIIATLLGRLLPAVITARESARRAQGSNMIRVMAELLAVVGN